MQPRRPDGISPRRRQSVTAFVVPNGYTGGVWFKREPDGTYWPLSKIGPYAEPRLRMLPPAERRRILRTINAKSFRHLHVWLTFLLVLAGAFITSEFVIRSRLPQWLE